MDIKEDIEKVRSLIRALQDLDLLLKEKQSDAMLGHNFGMDNTKVQTTLKTDRMENAIIESQELEERRQELFLQYWDEKEAVMRIIEQYAKTDDIVPLHRYLIGCDLSQIPLKDNQKKPQTVVNGAIKRLQATIDREEEIARQPEAVQELIRGGKKKCKRCETGFIKFKKEEADRFVFACTGCGRKLKADKLSQSLKRKNER